MNDSTIEALTKLAGELTDRVDALEKENGSLRARLDEQLSKQAAAKDEVVSVVSEQVADATLDALVKAGSLNRDQVEESRRVLLTDAEAPHRILQHILDAQSQSKTASDDSDDLSGGRLACGNPRKGSDPQSDCLDRMMNLLKLN